VRLNALRLCACAFFASLAFCIPAVAERTAPSFTVQDLNGGTISADSYRGQTLLLQFWTTWCPHCKRDQRALDNIAAEYAGQGVSVLAIDVGESAEKVKQFLQASPRSVPVALDPNDSVASRFGGGGVPHYVVINRDGNIVAMMSGAAGEQGLRTLLSHAFTSKGNSVQMASRAPTPSTSGSGPQWITVPSSSGFSHMKPLPRTVFVLLNGEKLESEHYVIQSGFVDITVADQVRRVDLSQLDTKQTLALNHKNGVDLKIPASRNEVFIGF
jgi:cytochrome c biogenesis protein CcmG, thiol:disulfide interchange protein DsbE